MRRCLPESHRHDTGVNASVPRCTIRTSPSVSPDPIIVPTISADPERTESERFIDVALCSAGGTSPSEELMVLVMLLLSVALGAKSVGRQLQPQLHNNTSTANTPHEHNNTNAAAACRSDM